MLEAALRALRDTFSPGLRQVLWKALGLTIALFILILFSVQVALSMLVGFSWPWVDTLIAVAAGLGLVAGLLFLMAPATAMFAGLYVDDIADLVERRDYPHDPPGRPLPLAKGVLTGVRFGLIVLAVNLALLPTLLLGIGAIAMVLANAYLLGREYFEIIAMRHMPADEARRLRKESALRILAAGFIPAFLVVVPFVNIITPIFSTVYFVHIFKRIRADRERA
ncbi:MAG TPA: sulfate transporter family protein [Aestuariivirgaceae bacterium]|nr:sulfate transporter family protein [Aestuariivirgaceae bacterium]